MTQGEALVEAGKYAEAEPIFRKVLDARRSAPGRRRGDEIKALTALAGVIGEQGRYAEAEAMFRQSLDLAVRGFGEESLEAAQIYASLAINLGWQSRSDEAEPLARRALDIRTRLLGASHADTIASLEQVAGNHAERGQFGEAVKLQTRALQLRSGLPQDDPKEVAASENNLAYFLNGEARFAEAEPHYRKALQIWRQLYGEDHPVVGSGYNNVAANLGDQGRFAEAEPLYRKALEISLKTLGESHPSIAMRYNNLASDLRMMGPGRWEEAEAMMRKALDLWRTSLGDRHHHVGVAAGNLGLFMLESGKKEAAEPLLREAVEINRAALGPNHQHTASAEGSLAMFLESMDRPAEARPLRKAAVATFEAGLGTNHPLTALNLSLLANNHALLDERAEAEAVGLRSVQAARRARTLAVGGNSLDLAKLESSDENTLPLVFSSYLGFAYNAPDEDPAEAARQKAEGFLAAQDLINPYPMRAMALAAARSNATDPALAALVREQQDLVEAARDADAKLLDRLGKGDADAARSLQAEYDRLVARLGEVETQLDRQFPEYRELVSPSSMPVDEVRKALAPDEAVLLVVASSDKVQRFLVTPQKVAWAWSGDPPGDLLALVAAIRCEVDDLTCSPERLREREALPETPFEKKGFRRFDLAAAHKLYSLVFDQFDPELKEVRRLYVTTTPNLADLPFSLLVTRPPAPGADPADPAVLRSAGWLADRFAITSLPAVSALRLADRSATGGTDFVGYGDPVLEGQKAFFQISAFAGQPSTRGARLADPAQLRSLEPLPGTRTELLAMGALFGNGQSAIKLGAAATESAVRNDRPLASARIVAFATHGLLPSPEQGYAEAGLVLTPPANASPDDDGILTASEVASLALSADWVILSACNSATPGGANAGTGLSGLSRAFLYAGARSLLASHWRVSDDATAALTVETLKAWRGTSGLSRSQALQGAMRAVRTGKRADGSALPGWTPDWSHPAAWAPFSYIANRDR